ncbi:hypothetical protein G9C85_12960 [Halorubellus sp. JP-L1]|uniref:restriction endonuclease subunit S n=1 Tax=Halorubellus sp. JP-L1 TaxID=2715753 RepID=UPI0014097FD9|nr:restriction endonuclease subunit S [Halorubellus sp. JP-L1]NHN42530.1 hypothetical protein [Halorubellus sp. JP-L1]
MKNPASAKANRVESTFPELPTEWEWVSLKHLCSISAEYGLNISSSEYGDDGIRLIRTTDILEKGALQENDAVYIPPSEAGDTILKDGDILISRSGTVGLPFRYDSSIHGPCTFASYLVRFRPQDHLDSRFFEYFTQSKLFEELVNAERSESTISNVSGRKFAQFSFPKPPVERMRLVADYLDFHIETIDELIKYKKNLLGLLDEKRRAVIEDFMASDGKSVPLKYLVDSTPGYAFPSAEFTTNSENMRLLRGVNVGVGELNWDETVYWPEEKIDDFEDFLLQPGDIVLGMDRPWISDGIRVAKLDESDCPSLLVQRVLRIRAKAGVDQKYVRMILESERFRQYFEPITTGVSVPHISREQVNEFEVPLPQESSQTSISAKWVDFCKTKERLEETINQSIRLLEEKRLALITKAVTGQIDLSDWQQSDKQDATI